MTMRDAEEGLASDGTIRTGARRDRLAEPFRDVLGRSVERVHSEAPTASVYVYGSVATGMAHSPRSDVDLLTIGLHRERAGLLARQLSAESAARCRGVEIAAAMPTDFHGDGDEAYGGRVFLRHYCVHLAGPDLDRSAGDFPGDRRPARGFNGERVATAPDVTARLDDTVSILTDHFADAIGLWPDEDHDPAPASPHASS